VTKLSNKLSQWLLVKYYVLTTYKNDLCNTESLFYFILLYCIEKIVIHIKNRPVVIGVY